MRGCATHLVQHDVNLVVIRDLLGHRQITSTQIYLHTTAHDMKELARNHPVGRLAPTIAALLEGVRLPIDHPPRRRPLGRPPTTPNARPSAAGVRPAVWPPPRPAAGQDIHLGEIGTHPDCSTTAIRLWSEYV